jgi:hypothetical protein
VGFKEKMNLSLSLGYAPFVPVAGYLAKGCDMGLYPSGVCAHFSFLPFKRGWGNIGAEMALVLRQYQGYALNIQTALRAQAGSGREKREKGITEKPLVSLPKISYSSTNEWIVVADNIRDCTGPCVSFIWKVSCPALGYRPCPKDPCVRT